MPQTLNFSKRELRLSVNVIFYLFFFSVTIPGSYHELNIHYGVLVGGMGSFHELFLGNQENFRGCLEDLTFNGVDVFEKAKVRGRESLSYIFEWRH